MKSGSFLVNFARNEEKVRYYAPTKLVRRYHNYPYALGTPIPVEDRMRKSNTQPKIQGKRRTLNDSEQEVRDFLSSSQKIPNSLKKEIFMKSLQNPRMRSVKLVQHSPRHKSNNYIRNKFY